MFENDCEAKFRPMQIPPTLTLIGYDSVSDARGTQVPDGDDALT